MDLEGQISKYSTIQEFWVGRLVRLLMQCEIFVRGFEKQQGFSKLDS